MTWEKSAYHCYLKGWTRIQNEAFWLEFSTRYQAGESRFEIQLQEKSNLNSIYMLLFLKGSRVTVAGKYQLGASSLDKYEGKASSLELQDSREKMMLYPNSGMRMQVIPLARVDEFWKSDFLVAFSLNQENPRWTLQVR
jgi:hypothetical protein